MYRILYFFPVLLLAALSTGCYKDPEVITQKIVETDTLYVSVHDTLTLTKYSDTATTFILVRHAETTGVGSNPPLSAAGQVRATELVRILKNLDLTGVYASNYERTMQTAQAVSVDHGVAVETYDPLEPIIIADKVLTSHRGQVVLVVGHSNTIPTLLNTLTGSTAYTTIPDAQYDNLYVVTVVEKGRAEVVHLKYGQ